MAVIRGLIPYFNSTNGGAGQVAAYAVHPDVYPAIAVAGIVVAVTVWAAMQGVGRLIQGRTPRLALIATPLATAGWIMVVMLGTLDAVAYELAGSGIGSCAVYPSASPRQAARPYSWSRPVTRSKRSDYPYVVEAAPAGSRGRRCGRTSWYCLRNYSSTRSKCRRPKIPVWSSASRRAVPTGCRQTENHRYNPRLVTALGIRARPLGSPTVALQDLGTGKFYLLSAVVSLLTYTPYVLLQPPPESELLPAFGLACLMAVTFGATAEAIRRGPLGAVSPITALSPTLTAVLAILVLHERVGLPVYVGVAVAPTGIVLLSMGDQREKVGRVGRHSPSRRWFLTARAAPAGPPARSCPVGPAAGWRR